MKKIFCMLFVAAMLSVVFVSCGDEKDEPKNPVSQLIESVHSETNDTYLVWDINTEKDSSSIYVYNVQFDPRAPLMTIRVDAPVTIDKSGKIYTFAGTGIHPYLFYGDRFVQFMDDAYLVTNLISTVNIGEKMYSISFDCHGGHYDKTGQLK